MQEKDSKKENIKETPKTEADIIWDDIKNLDLNLYSLANQQVTKHCKPVPMDPNKLYLSFDNYRQGMILPALEELVKGKYLVEQVDRFLVVSKKMDK